MKTCMAAVFLIIFQNSQLRAQDSTYIPEFGKAELSELQMKDCSFSPGASAINLLKYKEVQVSRFPNGTTELETLTRYRTKIFNKAGYKNAEITIPFTIGETLKSKNIQAFVYNLDENGKVVTTCLKKEDIFKEDGGKNDYSKAIKFTFPEVRDGSVIEYQVLRIHKMSYYVPTWYFQDNIPNLLTVYRVNRPTFSLLEKRMVANLPVEETQWVDDSRGAEKTQMQNVYIMRNVPAFKEEAFMSSPYDYLLRVDFLIANNKTNEIFSSWKSVNSQLLNSYSFAGAVDSWIPGSGSFIDSVKKLNDEPSRIRAVYNYVRKQLKWNGYYYIYSRDLEEVWKEGSQVWRDIGQNGPWPENRQYPVRKS